MCRGFDPLLRYQSLKHKLMTKIKDIFIFHQKGMDPLVPYVKGAINDVMNCFAQYKQFFPITNLGNWQSENAYAYHNGGRVLKAYESIEWYLERAKQRAIQEGRWQTTGQVNVEQMMFDLSNDPYFQQIPQWGIYLTTYDLYGGAATNFCVGITHPNAFSVLSTRRFLDHNNHLNLNDFLTTVQHEFGHIIRLTEGNHPNVEYALGPHCKNSECIMQQRMSGDFSDVTENRLKRKAAGLPPICPDCMLQGRKALFRLYAAHENGHHPNAPFGPHGPHNPNGGRS